MKGVILAAGDGGRLLTVTLGTPKVLLEVGGSPLIHYPLRALRSAGIKEIVVVVGHQYEKVLDALAETHPYLRFAYNEHYEGGNATSLYSARSFVEDDAFVVCMGDHAISPGIIESLLSSPRDGCVLCVDLEAFHPSQIGDATKVRLAEDGSIASIGKHLGVWDAVDTGVFKMTSEVFPAIEVLMDAHGVDATITGVLQHMAAGGRPFASCDVSGMLWVDVDTPEDYQTADALLTASYGERV